MKKILFFTLAVCILVLALGCSSDPVEFSEELRNNRSCYIDVVEIIPDSSDLDMFYITPDKFLIIGEFKNGDMGLPWWLRQ